MAGTHALTRCFAFGILLFALMPSVGSAACGAGDPASVIKSCTAVIAAGGLPAPDLSQAYARRAAAYDNKSLWSRAVADADRAIALDPDDGLALFARGQAFLGLNRLGDAIADAQAAVNINPALAQPSIGLALTAAQQGQPAFLESLLDGGVSAAGIDVPLPLDAARGHPDLVRKLIDAGASVDETNPAGETALYLAVADDDVAQAKLLLGLGADPDLGGPYAGFMIQNVMNRQPPDAAMMQVLLDGGASLVPVMGQEQPGVDDRAQFSTLSPAMRAVIDPWVESYQNLYNLMTPVLNRMGDAQNLTPGEVSTAQFARMLAAAQGVAQGDDIQVLFVLLAGGVRTLPPVPSSARSDASQAQQMFAAAQTASAILDAAAVYEEAARAAPWVDEYHERLCTLYQLGGAYARADTECQMVPAANTASGKSEIQHIENELAAVRHSRP